MTGRQLFHHCRKLGITLSRKGDRLAVDYPTKEAWTPELRQSACACKAELLAILDGDYTRAAMHLVLRESQPSEWRDGLVQSFDERMACCIESMVPYEQACKTAYIEIAREIELTKLTNLAKRGAA